MKKSYKRTQPDSIRSIHQFKLSLHDYNKKSGKVAYAKILSARGKEGLTYVISYTIGGTVL